MADTLPLVPWPEHLGNVLEYVRQFFSPVLRFPSCTLSILFPPPITGSGTLFSTAYTFTTTTEVDTAPLHLPKSTRRPFNGPQDKNEMNGLLDDKSPGRWIRTVMYALPPMWMGRPCAATFALANLAHVRLHQVPFAATHRLCARNFVAAPRRLC